MSATAPTDTSSADTAAGCGCLTLGVLVLVALAGISFGRFHLDRNDYDAGHQAYQRGDCATAVERFASVTGAWRPLTPARYANLARPEQDECQELVDVAAAEAGDPALALARAAAFVVRHTDSPLAPLARERAAGLVERTDPAALAGPASCGDVPTIERTGVLSGPEAPLGPFTVACGAHLREAGRATDAVVLLERFLARHRDHPSAPTVTDELGRAMLAESAASGGLSAPTRHGATPGDPALRIRNLSSRRMRMVLSGPVTRVEELAGCAHCPGSTIISPVVCGGPVVVDQTLPAGAYRVVVRVIEEEGDGHDDRIRPFAGEWRLDQGAAYDHCLYIRTTFSHNR